MDHRLRPLGITRSQWAVLSALAQCGDAGLTQVELARRLDVGKVTIGGLVDRLEANGHVERRPDAGGDRRIKRVFMGARGRMMIGRMTRASDDLDSLIMAELSAAEIAQLENILQRIRTNIRTAAGAGTIAAANGAEAGADV